MYAAVQQTETFEYYATEHFRASGVYWGATGLATLGRLHLLDADDIVAWTLSCRCECVFRSQRPNHHCRCRFEYDIFNDSIFQLFHLSICLCVHPAHATCRFSALQPEGSLEECIAGPMSTPGEVYLSSTSCAAQQWRLWWQPSP